MRQVFSEVTVISAVPLYSEPSRFLPSTLYLPPTSPSAARAAEERERDATSKAVFNIVASYVGFDLQVASHSLRGRQDLLADASLVGDRPEPHHAAVRVDLIDDEADGF